MKPAKKEHTLRSVGGPDGPTPGSRWLPRNRRPEPDRRRVLRVDQVENGQVVGTTWWEHLIDGRWQFVPLTVRRTHTRTALFPRQYTRLESEI